MNMDELSGKLVSWIRDRVSSAGCLGVVLGLSGGLDSSVLGVLCQRAFPRTTLGLIMPCHSNMQDREHARLLASRFSITTRQVPLDDVFNVLHNMLPPVESVNPALSKLAEANLKARLRMLTLYYFANQLQYMVVGSSDRGELTVGYFTKYGDGGSDIMPLGGLVKGQVRELARFLQVPQPIIDKPPSPGLWEGQTAEAELGLRYEEIDRYLITGEATPDVAGRVNLMKARSSHKRVPPPVPDFEP